MEKYILTVFWPGYHPKSYSSQNLFFKSLLDNIKTRIYFITGDNQNSLTNNNDIIIWDFPSYRLGKLSFFQIVKMIYKISITLVIRRTKVILTSTQFPLHTKISFILAKILNIKFIVYTEAWKFSKSKNIFRNLYHKLSMKLLFYSDFVCVQSKYKLQIYKNFGINQARLKILPFLISDLSGYSEEKILQKSNNHTKKFLYVGRLDPIKGVDILIKSFSILTKQNFDIELYIAGDGFLKSSLINLSKMLNLDNIYFLGWVEEQEKIKLYEKANYFILPSIKMGSSFEGWGIVLQEAISFGLPSIATDAVGSAMDLINPGVNGYIVKNNCISDLIEAMQKFLNFSKQSYINSSISSRRIFEQYNSQKQFLSTLKSMITK